jgi:hypothetical protein
MHGRWGYIGNNKGANLGHLYHVDQEVCQLHIVRASW